MNKTKKYRLNLLICLGSLLLLLVYVYFVEGMDNIVALIQKVNPWWILVGLLLMAGYWLFESIILHIITKRLHPKQRFARTFRVSMVGQFFNCITPFASGGQPMQAYSMYKSGMDVGTAGTALLTKFIVYQVALTIYSLIIIVFQMKFFLDWVQGFVYLILLGFTINTVVVVFLFCIAFYKNTLKKLVHKCISLLHKLHIIKHPEAIEERAFREIEQFHEDFQTIKKQKWMLLGCGILTAVQLTFFLLVPYAVFRGFGLIGADIVRMMSAAAFVMLLSSFVPIPGTIGAAEGSFYLVFSIFFPESLISMAILFWRLFTFYLPIVAGGIAVMIHNKEDKLAQTVEESQAAG